jgi:hypothetical protein
MLSLLIKNCKVIPNVKSINLRRFTKWKYDRRYYSNEQPQPQAATTEKTETEIESKPSKAWQILKYDLTNIIDIILDCNVDYDLICIGTLFTQLVELHSVDFLSTPICIQIRSNIKDP